MGGGAKGLGELQSSCKHLKDVNCAEEKKIVSWFEMGGGGGNTALGQTCDLRGLIGLGPPSLPRLPLLGSPGAWSHTPGQGKAIGLQGSCLMGSPASWAVQVGPAWAGYSIYMLFPFLRAGFQIARKVIAFSQGEKKQKRFLG